MPQISLPYIHPNVDLDDLQPNGKLMSDDMIKKLQDMLNGEPDGRYSKERLNQLLQKRPGETIQFPYSIIKKGDTLIAIYKGEKQDKHLGKGGFGVTKIQQDLITGNFDVTKVINVQNASEKDLGYFKKEISHLKKLGLLVTKLSHNSVRKGKQLIIGMKLAEGNELGKLVSGNRYNHFNPLQRFMMAKSLLEATQAAHAVRILHRDIKPANFVTHPGILSTQLVDFGLAKTANKSFLEKVIAFLNGSKNKDELEIKNDGVVGTGFYMAPEIRKGKTASYNEATEVYALGITINEIFGSFIEDKCLPKNPESRKQLEELLDRMMHKDPAQRPSLAEALEKINVLLQGEYDNEFKVGVIQAEEFMDLPSDKRRDLIQQMKAEGVTAVAIADASQDKPDFAFYQNIKKEFEAQCFLNVMPAVFHGATKQELQQEAAQYFQNHFHATNLTVYEISKSVKNLTAPSQTSVKTSEEAQITTTPSMPTPPANNSQKWVHGSLTRVSSTLFSSSQPQTPAPSNQETLQRQSKKVS